MVYNWLRSTQTWLSPGRCLACTAALPGKTDFCPACERSLPRFREACPVCAAAAPADGPCGQCQKHPPTFTRTLAAFAYVAPIDQLIWRMKYRGRLDLTRALGEQLAAHLARALDRPPDRLVPVPLHRARLRERGYNQSLELARPVARRLGLTLDPYSLQRVRPTPPQMQLPHAERARNIRGAFAARTSFTGQRIAIVDDVMTTGATVHELARCLRRAGAAAVEVWVVARA